MPLYILVVWHSRRHLSFFLATILLTNSLLLSGCVNRSPQPLAKNGNFDLSKWNFHEDGIIQLDGQWSFYWNKLLVPDDFINPILKPDSEVIHLPSRWNDFQLQNGHRLGGQGFATFRLVVHLPTDKQLKVIRLANILCSYRLWLNGELVATMGTVASKIETDCPRVAVEFVPLPHNTDTLDLVLQVSNHHFRDGGIMSPILLGLEQQILHHQAAQWGMSLFLAGSLIILGLYHFVLFWQRKKDASPLFLGLYCLLWAGNNLTAATSGALIYQLLPSVPWSTLMRVDLLCYMMSMPVLIQLYFSLYPEERSTAVFRIALAVSLAFSAVVCFTPMSVFSNIVPWFHNVQVLFQAYTFFVLYVAFKRHRPGVAAVFVGTVIMTLAGINDMLHDIGVIHTAFILPVGILLFILSYAFVLSHTFSQAFSAVERLSEELSAKNIALSRLDGIKDEFLANTSHELRTPLQGIIGIAEGLMEGAAGAPTRAMKTNLSLMVGSAGRLAHIVNDLLDFSRLKHHDLFLQKRPVDLRAISETVITLLTPTARGKSLTLVNDVREKLEHAEGDEDRLQQILINLVGNAIKFTQEGRITVRAETRNTMIAVIVEDTGIGIPEEQQETIFESFEQVDSSSARQFGGTGLGLSITKKLVELHGGTIHVEAGTPKGSRFIFTLPISARQGQLTAEQVDPTDSPPTLSLIDHAASTPFDTTTPNPKNDNKNGLLVLAVDDEPINLQVVHNHLKISGIDMEPATSGPAALQRLSQEPLPDLVLLDIMMPGMTGYEVCRRIRQQWTAGDLPIIMLTAKNRVTDLVEGFSCGANDYISKPFFKDELISRVRSQLQQKEAHLALKQHHLLKAEIEHRKKTETRLRAFQRRLAVLLDTVEDGVIAVNGLGEIGFCNQSAEKLFSNSASAMLGRPVNDYLAIQRGAPPDASEHMVEPCFPFPDDSTTVSLGIRKNGSITRVVNWELNALEQDDDDWVVLISRQTEARDLTVTPAVIKEMNLNHKRLQQFEEALLSLPSGIQNYPENLRHELEIIDSSLANISGAGNSGEQHESRRHLAVEVMTLSIDYWCEATGSTRFDLARASEIWKVYTNLDGWERTQTLDRYLDIHTCPKQPRWKRIYATADYVLAACQTESPTRNRLMESLSRLRKLHQRS